MPHAIYTCFLCFNNNNKENRVQQYTLIHLFRSVTPIDIYIFDNFNLSTIHLKVIFSEMNNIALTLALVLFYQLLKRVLLQTVKTQMKCSIKLYFIRVYTVYKVKKIFRQKNKIFFEKFNLTPLDVYNGLSQVIVSNHKDESFIPPLPTLARNIS